jgi:hypothetical protein
MFDSFTSGIYLTGGWVGSRADLDVMAKKNHLPLPKIDL